MGHPACRRCPGQRLPAPVCRAAAQRRTAPRVAYSTTPLNAGTPAGAVKRCPTFIPFSPSAAVSASQLSASVPGAGAVKCCVADRCPRKCARLICRIFRKLAKPAFALSSCDVPVVGAREKALHNADDAFATAARFNSPLARDRWRPGEPTVGRRGEHPWRIPGRYLGAHLRPRAEAHLHRDRLAVAFLEFSWHEPRRNTWTGGDRLPHFFRRAGDFEFGVPSTGVRTASCFTLMTVAPWEWISAVAGTPRAPVDARGRRGWMHRGTSKRALRWPR